MRTLLASACLAVLLALATQPSVSAQEPPGWMKQTVPDADFRIAVFRCQLDPFRERTHESARADPYLPHRIQAERDCIG